MRSTATGRRRRLATLGAALVMTAGLLGAGTVASGAWFTASASGSVKGTGALLSIGEVGTTRDRTTIAVSGVYPMTDAQASASARREWITVRNTGTIPLAWTLAVVNPQAVDPLTADKLARFRFQLFSESGAALTGPLSLGAMPAFATPGVFHAQGSSLAAGGQAKVDIRVWLATDATDEYQGAGATFDVVINGMQTEAGGIPSAIIPLSAIRSGTPVGTATKLEWGSASAALASAGASGSPTYTVERSATGDFTDAVTVYTGPALSAVDSSGDAPRTVSVSSVAGGQAKTLSVGRTASCAILTSGQGACWGWAPNGRLGTGLSTSNASMYLASPTLLASGSGARALTRMTTGYWGSCAIDDAARLYCWGPNTITTSNVTTAPTVPTRFTRGALLDKRVVDVSVGGGYAHWAGCAVVDTGAVVCWSDQSPTPAVVSGGVLAGAKVVDVEVGDSTACALTAGGAVACWDPYSTTSAVTALDLSALGSEKITKLSSGEGVGCVLTDASSIYCWGSNYANQYGAKPVRVDTTGLTRISDFTSTVRGICAVDTGSLYCWGASFASDLGLGSSYATAATPQKLAGSLAGRDVVAVESRGGEHTCALTSDGLVSCWGNRYLGALGDGTVTGETSTPSTVTGTAVQNTLCAAGASLLIDGTCSLSSAVSYTYRVSYTAPSLPGWVSPKTVARRD